MSFVSEHGRQCMPCSIMTVETDFVSTVSSDFLKQTIILRFLLSVPKERSPWVFW